MLLVLAAGAEEEEQESQIRAAAAAARPGAFSRLISSSFCCQSMSSHCRPC